jgi:hypothetical protein
MSSVAPPIVRVSDHDWRTRRGKYRVVSPLESDGCFAVKLATPPLADGSPGDAAACPKARGMPPTTVRAGVVDRLATAGFAAGSSRTAPSVAPLVNASAAIPMARRVGSLRAAPR